MKRMKKAPKKLAVKVMKAKKARMFSNKVGVNSTSASTLGFNGKRPSKLKKTTPRERQKRLNRFDATKR